MPLQPKAYKPTPGLVTEAMGDEAIVLHLERNTCFALNAVGTFIWQRLNAGDTVPQIVQAVETHFDTTPPQAQHDVAEFLTHLADQNLIEPR